MKKKIAIVGFGTAGQRFFAYLKKKNNINIIKIIVKNKRNIFGLNIAFKFFLKKLNKVFKVMKIFFINRE